MNGISKKTTEEFSAFLVAGGAELLKTTNAWEVARFRTHNGICVVYQNKAGRITFSNEHAHDAFTAYQDKRTWSAIEVSKRIERKTVEELIIERDGTECFFCGQYFNQQRGSATLEHLLSISHGGSNHLSNLVLAHEDCNIMAGNLPIIDKVKLREKLRGGQ